MIDEKALIDFIKQEQTIDDKAITVLGFDRDLKAMYHSKKCKGKYP